MGYFCNPVNMEYRYQLFRKKAEKDSLPFPVHDYAPDLRVVGEYLSCCAGKSATEFLKAANMDQVQTSQIPELSVPLWPPGAVCRSIRMTRPYFSAQQKALSRYL